MSTVETETTEDVIIRGVNITKCIAEIADVGYIVVPDFVNQEEIAKIRHSFDTEVPMTEMRAIGVNTGKTMRAHNLLAKTRAVDWLFLDERVPLFLKLSSFEGPQDHQYLMSLVVNCS